MTLAPAELEAIRRQAPKIKRFVSRHGERSARIFSRALGASFKGPAEFTRFLLTQPREDDPVEACLIVRAVGQRAASLIPALIASYYSNQNVDHSA